MDHHLTKQTQPLKRVGFHYFQDVERYSAADADLWSARLKAINADWIILKNPLGRAIPESFIRRLAQKDINIVVDFDMIIGQFDGFSDVEMLLDVYQKWGVGYACLFSKPNSKACWGDTGWIENDIVEKHAEYFGQFARLCVERNIHPILSPLDPSGDYPDLPFFERSLQILTRDCSPAVLDQLVLSCLAWNSSVFNSGMKGDKNGTDIHARKTTDKNDGLLSRQFEEYSRISENIFGRKPPMILMQTGYGLECDQKSDSKQVQKPEAMHKIIKLSRGENVFMDENSDQLIAPISSEVLAVCIWLLSAEESSQHANYRWFTQEGDPLPTTKNFLPENNFMNQSQPKTIQTEYGQSQFAYHRYVYIDPVLRPQMPTILEQLTPYIKRHKPMVGFSLIEGAKAAYLLVITKDQEKFLEENQPIMQTGNVFKVVSMDQLNAWISEKL